MFFFCKLNNKKTQEKVLIKRDGKFIYFSLVIKKSTRVKHDLIGILIKIYKIISQKTSVAVTPPPIISLPSYHHIQNRYTRARNRSAWELSALSPSTKPSRRAITSRRCIFLVAAMSEEKTDYSVESESNRSRRFVVAFVFFALV